MLADDLAIIRQQLEFPDATLARSGGPGLTGVIDQQTWLTYQTALTAVFATEFTRSWFRNRAERGEFDQGFVDSVNALFSDHPVGPTRSIRQTLGFDPQ